MWYESSIATMLIAVLFSERRQGWRSNDVKIYIQVLYNS